VEKPLVGRWVRFGVSAGLLAILLSLVPLAALGAALRRVPGRVLVIASLLFMAGHIIGAMKWRWLQGGSKSGLSVVQTLRAHFAGVIANLWLPSVAGGDLVRAGAGARQSGRTMAVAVASVIDRLADTAALLLLAGAGILLVGARSEAAHQVFLAAVGVVVASVALATAGWMFLRTRAGDPRARQVLDALDVFVRRPSVVAGVFAISLAVQAMFIGINISLGRAVGVAAPLGAWLMAWPLSKLAALAPISAAGIGVREAALVLLLRPFGDSPEAILAAGLLWQAVFISGGAIGWGLLSLLFLSPPAGREQLQSSGR
jgi:uncharacterized membrane protein YbhN (UPF0104 family)